MGRPLTGRSGPWSLGVLDAQTGPAGSSEGDGDNWGVVRAKRQIGRTSVGLLSTRHEGEEGVNSLYGADVDVQATPRLKLRSFWTMTDDARSRRASGEAWIQRGDFFGGERLAHGVKLRLVPSRHFRLETSWDHNDIDLPAGSFSTDLFRQRIAVALTPDLSAAAFAQWSDAAELMSANLRFGWSYRPGSDLFLVLNQTWDAPEWGQRSVRDRQAILKMTWLFAV